MGGTWKARVGATWKARVGGPGKLGWGDLETVES